MTFDAIVLGAGVIGAATAYELAKDGLRVCVVDKGAVGGGSTSSSSAVVRTFYSTHAACALAHEGFHAWDRFADHVGRVPGPVARLYARGAVVMKTPGNDGLRGAMAMSRDLSIPYDEWDAARLAEALPHYDLASYAPCRRPEDAGFAEPNGARIEGAVFWPRSGWVDDPQLAARNLMDAAVREGAAVRRGTVVAVRRGDRVEGVTLDDGTRIDAPVLVLCAGPWSRTVLAMAGVDDLRVGVRPLRQECAHVPPPPGIDVDALPVVSDDDVGVYMKPGRTLAIGTQGPPCDPEVEEDPDAFDRSPTDQWTAQVMRYAQRVPTLGIPSRMAGVTDLYDASDDWLPIYDRAALPGLFLACGSSGNQFKNAPVAGWLMARLVAHQAAGGDHDARPLSLVLPRTGATLDLSAFSRRRPPTAASSFSVLG
ncbi:FAD-binding oxidoreductase [Jannaschia sp. Os4]|uniref:NAD(P)/FAD-dependent oxidoreductase n=1 Tax=Jannaschia sp. Os4 TaxID=2807617 RepID=UPI00193A5CF7|nr:FAD-binding oxidoreductase [Jannaschia sp. Os4]MBM2576926.1 FAD-binding oxidoreductase [Jannaschia sp. Os4]